MRNFVVGIIVGVLCSAVVVNSIIDHRIYALLMKHDDTLMAYYVSKRALYTVESWEKNHRQEAAQHANPESGK